MRGMKMVLIALAALAAACGTNPPHDDPSAAARSLAQAERAFAARSVRENARAAFLAHFASDGMLVRNGWTAAMPALEAQGMAPLVLDWHPVYVEAARSGDLGLSTGPWTLTPRDPARHVGHGQFVSVWRREHGQWKVMADIGISHPEPALEDAALETRVAQGGCASAESLEQAEARFSALAQGEDVRSALHALAASGLRFYREGAPPRLGLEAVLASGAAEASARRYSAQGARVAQSGELGFTSGSYAGVRDAEHGAWLRVWRCEPGGWRVALDITNAMR